MAREWNTGRLCETESDEYDCTKCELYFDCQVEDVTNGDFIEYTSSDLRIRK